MQEIWLKIIGVLGALFLFGFAVFIHELGHFLAARLFGVGVRKFAIGMGPKIWAVVRGETEYSIRWIPLGGFVALQGMDDEEDKEPAAAKSKEAGKPAEELPPEQKKTDKSGAVADDLHALRGKPAYARIAVFAAGVTCNFLSAIVLMGLLLWYGLPALDPLAPVVEQVPPATPLYEAGWRTGDRIVGVNGDPLEDSPLAENPDLAPRSGITCWEDIEERIALRLPERRYSQSLGYIRGKLFGSQPRATTLTLEITVERDDQRVTLPWSSAWLSEPGGRYFSPAFPPVVGAVIPNSPAHNARLVKAPYEEGEEIRPYPTWNEMPETPLQADDRILAVDHEPVHTWDELTGKLQANPNRQVTLTIRRGQAEEARNMLLATVLERKEDGSQEGQLGIIMGRPTSDKRDRLPFLDAVLTAPMATFRQADMILYQTMRLFEQPAREIKRNLGGPVVIGILAYKSAQRGLANYLNLFVVISLILAIMNLLPIPILDGGYIAITLLETVIRRPIPDRLLNAVLTTFMILFIMLFGFIFYNDIMNWIIRI